MDLADATLTVAAEMIGIREIASMVQIFTGAALVAITLCEMFFLKCKSTLFLCFSIHKDANYEVEHIRNPNCQKWV